MNRILLVCLVLATCLAASQALQCYTCSTTNSKCKDNPWGVSKNTCSGAQNACKKVVRKGDGTVSRGCIRMQDCPSNPTTTETYYCCKGELCNSGSTGYANIFLLAAAFIGLYLFKRN